MVVPFWGLSEATVTFLLRCPQSQWMGKESRSLRPMGIGAVGAGQEGGIQPQFQRVAEMKLTGRVPVGPLEAFCSNCLEKRSQEELGDALILTLWPFSRREKR